MKSLLIATSIFAFLIGTPAPAPFPASVDEGVVSGDMGRKLDEYLTRLEPFGFAGGALAVVGKDVLLRKSYGLADRARHIPLTPDSVYNLGSITKQFTAAAILKLEMEGRLKVTDAASRYLEGVPVDKAGMTLHHLLTHSSGLESDFSPTDYEPVGREEYVRRALRSKLLFQPGKGYEYSNAGYSLLAAIVERVSGKDYEDFLTEKILKPAGMHETGYKRPRWAAERVAHGYRDGEDWGTILQRIQPPGAPFWMLRGNGGLHTTLADMLAWHRALDSNAVLNRQAREKFFTPYVAEGPAAQSFYAYGWAVGKSDRGTRVIQHNGGNGIYVTEFLRFPDEKAMLFVASTDTGTTATPVVEILERILFGGKVAVPPPVVSLPPGRLAQIAGTWRLPGGGEIKLAVEGKALSLHADSQEAFSALSAATSEQALRFVELTARTAEIAAKAFSGDVSKLHEAFGGGMRIEEVRAQEAEMMKDRESRLGPFRKSGAIGAMPRDRETVRVFIRLDFEKGSVYNIYLWGPRRILGMRGIPDLPVMNYMPLSETEFASFTLQGGETERRFRIVGKEGREILSLGAPGAPIEALKIQ
jgi:CubicO group peptidase (beta-lactamase class C family)